ncbi:MAG: DNA-directed RNA polymerase subunit D [Sulfolobales archaeon]
MNLNVSVVERGDNYIKLLFEGVPLQLVNAIRRVALAEVPSMAIADILFIDNTSALYDEIIAHRLGLVPLTSDEALNKYRAPEECVECGEVESCEGCYAILTLDISAKDETVTVYSGDLVSHDPDVRPVNPRIPIVVLAPGQRLAFEARARLGRGKEHIKWSPATVANVTYLAKITLDKGKCTLCGKCVEVCPRRVFSISSNNIKVDEGRCTLCRQCVKVCDQEAIDLSWYEGKYMLYIESSGALTPERIFLEALKIIINKLRNLYEEVNKLGGNVRGS